MTNILFSDRLLNHYAMLCASMNIFIYIFSFIDYIDFFHPNRRRPPIPLLPKPKEPQPLALGCIQSSSTPSFIPSVLPGPAAATLFPVAVFVNPPI